MKAMFNKHIFFPNLFSMLFQMLVRETNDTHLENCKHVYILVFENSQNYRDFDPSGKVLSGK
jgi:hypothetical protein